MTPPERLQDVTFIDALAQEIRRVDGSHKLGAAALAEAIAPFIAREAAAALVRGEPVATVESFTNGSYWRNYKLRWHRDVPVGTQLYATPPSEG